MPDAGRHAVVLDLAIESLHRSGKLRFRAQGASMMPAIHPGTCVEIRRATPDRIAPGDIVLLKTLAGLRLHRIVEIGPDLLITRGDNHEHNDTPADPRDLLGRLHSVSRPRRRWARFLWRLK